MDVEQGKKSKEPRDEVVKVHGAKEAPFTTNQILVIVMFVIMWTMDGMLIHSIHDVDYERASVTITIEIFKLVVASTLYFYYSNGTLDTFIKFWRRGILFSVVGMIYCVYNLLRFYAFSISDPGSVRILINFRILTTGILSQMFLNKKLGLRKWLSLIALVIGCITLRYETFSASIDIFVTVATTSALSSIAGVYSEKILKQDKDVDINLQNMYLYIFSISSTFVFILFTTPDLLNNTGVLYRNWSPIFIPIVVIGSGGGFMTGLMLKHVNAIAKEFSNAAEMLLLVIFSSILFGTEITGYVIISLVVVTASIIAFYWEKYSR